MKLKGVLLSGKVLISYYSRHEGGLALITYSEDAPKYIYDTMEYAFRMKILRE